MPKKVDYAARFELLEEAALEIVLESGVAALSRRTLAARLGQTEAAVRRLVDGDLPLGLLALRAVERQRGRRLGRTTALGVGRERALRLIGSLVPSCDEDLAAELVWWRVVAAGTGVSLTTREPELWVQRLLGERGWVEDEPPAGERSLGASETHPRLLGALHGWHQDNLAIVRHALELVGRDPADAEALLALAIGLTLATCTGLISLDDAHAALERALESAG